MQTDLLVDVLRLAQREGALEGEALEAFARALSERAELVVRERLSRVEALEREKDKASEAHDRLLAHHRQVVLDVIAELRSAARLPFFRWRLLRRRLIAVAESLRGETE